MDDAAVAIIAAMAELVRLRHGTKVEIREVFTSGKSGAVVAMVDCSGEHDGVFVLKIGPVPQGWEAEESRHRRALSEGAFGGCVPELVLSESDGQRYALLLRLAGKSRLRDYRGPQQASMDLGQGIIARITPLAKLTKDDEGSRISAFVSFSYEGIVGWDVELVS